MLQTPGERGAAPSPVDDKADPRGHDGDHERRGQARPRVDVSDGGTVDLVFLPLLQLLSQGIHSSVQTGFLK